MTTAQLTATATVRTATATVGSATAETATVHTEPLPTALRQAAERRRARAAALRAWSRDVLPELGRSLCRRAAELELAAVALELRADGIEAGDARTPRHQEEER